ncbi:MAG: hypothetical protein NXI01_03310 [Gammaproteobacteria bacterium]|nr:hypothetical protein [Gammaproteobacteria bacterium]
MLDLNKDSDRKPVAAKSWSDWGSERKGNFKYAAVAAVLLLSGGYLGALYFAPAMIPFGLSAMSTWTSMAVTATVGVVAAASAYFTLPQLMGSVLDTVGRLFNKDRLPTKTDMALLATVVGLGLSFVAMLYLAPAVLPAVLTGLGTWSKLAVASTVAIASVAAALPMFYKGPAMFKEGYGDNLASDLCAHDQEDSRFTL